jgi:hypothetical protein
MPVVLSLRVNVLHTLIRVRVSDEFGMGQPCVEAAKRRGYRQ